MTARPRPFWRTALLGLAATGFSIANLINALHKGGDFQVFVESGRRVLERLPLYEGSSAGVGVVGPPFQGLFFTPFALLAAAGMPLARIAWYLVGLSSLVAGVCLWAAALESPGRTGAAARPGLLARLTSASLLVPLLAILFPAQTNFEHQNMNPLLLVCLGTAAYAMRKGRNDWAGVLVGAATALKAYPGLLLAYFVYRRAWRALGAAIGAAALLSALPALVYGPRGLLALFEQWLAFSAAGGWPSVGNNQSVVAMIERTVGPHSALVAPLYAVSVLLLLGVFVWAAAPLVVVATGGPSSSQAGSDPHSIETARWLGAVDLALLTLVAVLASPIAWDHYWVLTFPVFFLVYNSERYRQGGWVAAIFWTALVLTSGVSRNTLGLTGFEAARYASNSTWAAILLFAAALAVRRDASSGRRTGDATPASTASPAPRP